MARVLSQMFLPLALRSDDDTRWLPSESPDVMEGPTSAWERGSRWLREQSLTSSLHTEFSHSRDAQMFVSDVDALS